MDPTATSAATSLPRHHGTDSNVPRGALNEQEQNLPPKKPSFSDLFKDQRRQSKSFLVRLWKEGERYDVKEEEYREMGACLIGFIMGRFPGMKEIEKVRSTWQVPHTFAMHESGWMLFRFNNEVDRDKVLEGGPYETFEDPWLIKPMPICFAFDDTCFSSIPTWIRFPGLPLHLWSEAILGKLMSQVGIPLSVDECTACMTRISFARVLVEVDATKPLTKEVSLTLANGEVFNQKVMYERAPIYCTKCRRIGHDVEHCKGRKYVPRRGPNTNAPTVVHGDKREEKEEDLATQEGVMEGQMGQNVQAEGVQNVDSPKAGNSAFRRYARERSRTRPIHVEAEHIKEGDQVQKDATEERFKDQNEEQVQAQKVPQTTPPERAVLASADCTLSPCQGSLTKSYMGKGKDKGKGTRPAVCNDHGISTSTKHIDKGKGTMNIEEGMTPLETPLERNMDGSFVSLSSTEEVCMEMPSESEWEDESAPSKESTKRDEKGKNSKKRENKNKKKKENKPNKGPSN